MILKCGIIGCGKVAQEMHIPNLLENNNVEVLSLCDNNDFQLNKSKKLIKKPIKIYENYSKMAEEEKLDFVNICTPGFTHYDIAKVFLNKGINVLTEKPLALHLDKIFELKKIAQENDTIIGVVMNYRYKDIVMKLKDAISEGLFGQIKKVHTIHHGPCVYNESQWLWDEKKSFNLIYESGIHFIDLQVYLNGPHKKIKYINPIYDDNLESTTELQAIIKYENGAEGYIDLAQTSLKHSSFNSWMNVYGTANDAFLRWFPPKISFETGFHEPIKQFYDEFNTLKHISNKVITNRFQEYRRESHKRVIDLFVDSLVSGSDFPINIDKILPTMTLLEEIKSAIPNYNWKGI